MIVFLTNIIAILFIIFFLYKQFGKDNKWIFWSLLCLKILTGLLVGILTLHLYGNGDTFSFFEKATEISKLPFKGYIQIIFGNDYKNLSETPRTFFFVKTLSFFTQINDSNYWLSSIYFSIISFVASWYFYLNLKKIYPNYRLAILCSLFIPSIIFWSSGVLKGSLSNSSLLFLVALTLNFYYKKNISWWEIFFGIISLVILLKLKHYLLISYVVFASILIAFGLLNKLKSKFKYLIFIGLIISMLFGIQKIHPYLTFNRIALTLYENHQIIRENTSEKNQLDLVLREPTKIEVISKMPYAIFIGLIKPSFLDNTPFVGIIHKIENLFLLLLISLTIFYYFKEKPNIDWKLVCISFSVLFIFLGIITLSTPNLGTLVRYRSAFMPFIFFIFGIFPEKLFKYHKSSSKPSKILAKSNDKSGKI